MRPLTSMRLLRLRRKCGQRTPPDHNLPDDRATGARSARPPTGRRRAFPAALERRRPGRAAFRQPSDHRQGEGGGDPFPRVSWDAAFASTLRAQDWNAIRAGRYCGKPAAARTERQADAIAQLTRIRRRLGTGCFSVLEMRVDLGIAVGELGRHLGRCPRTAKTPRRGGPRRTGGGG